MEQILFDLLIVAICFITTFIFQKVFPYIFNFLPFAIFAGLIAVILKLFGLKFSGNTYIYTDVFLAFIFGCFPLSIGSFNKSFFKKVLPLWRYSIFQYLIQWGGSLVIVTLILKNFFAIGDEFGAYLPSGFAGGHGSASVVGDLLYRGGIADAMSFTMFSATVGIILAISGGVLFCKFYQRSFSLKSFETSQVTLIKKDLLLIVVSVGISFLIRPLMIKFLNVNIPGFVIAVFVSFIFRQYFGARDNATLNKISNFSTDLLVIIGVGSINFALIKAQILPLLILFSFGLLQGVFVFLFLSIKVFSKEDAFEKALFTWGWSIGGLVIGLNLVQSLKERKNPKIIDEFAMTYLMISPLEISILLFGPYLLLNGYAMLLGIILFILAIFLLTYMLIKPSSV